MRQSGERDAGLMRFFLEHGVGAADDRHVMTALAQTGRGLKHLVHGAGVELIEFEDLEDAHRRGGGLYRR